jgi:hypothetical protein
VLAGLGPVGVGRVVEVDASERVDALVVVELIAAS